MTQLPILLSDYVPEDVYNMDETELNFKAHSNKTLAQGKMKDRKLQKEHITFAFVVNAIGIDKLKLLVTYKSKQPQCFGRWQSHEYVWWHSNKTTWMKREYLKLGFCSLAINSKVKIEK